MTRYGEPARNENIHCYQLIGACLPAADSTTERLSLPIPRMICCAPSPSVPTANNFAIHLVLVERGAGATRQALRCHLAFSPPGCRLCKGVREPWEAPRSHQALLPPTLPTLASTFSSSFISTSASASTTLPTEVRQRSALLHPLPTTPLLSLPLPSLSPYQQTTTRRRRSQRNSILSHPQLMSTVVTLQPERRRHCRAPPANTKDQPTEARMPRRRTLGPNPVWCC